MEAAAAGLRARPGRRGLRRASDREREPRVGGPVPPGGRRLAERRRSIPLDRDELQRPARRRVLRVRGEARAGRGAGHPSGGHPVDPWSAPRDGERAGVLDAWSHRHRAGDSQRADRVRPGVRAVGRRPDPRQRHRARDGRRRRHVPRGLGISYGRVLRDRLARPGHHHTGAGHAGLQDAGGGALDRAGERRALDRVLHLHVVRRHGAARDAERRHLVGRHDRRRRRLRRAGPR